MIALDFDGTVQHHPGTDSTAFTKPVDGALDFVLWAKEQGFEVVIYTARMAKVLHDELRSIRTANQISKQLRAWGFPLLRVVGHKVDAVVYLDDRGFRFEGPGTWAVLKGWIEHSGGASRWEREGYSRP